ncbi:unnamed protein product [Urochloa humidicola]
MRRWPSAAALHVSAVLGSTVTCSTGDGAPARRRRHIASFKNSEWLCLMPDCERSGEVIRRWEHAAILDNGRRSRHLQLSVALARVIDVR